MYFRDICRSISFVRPSLTRHTLYLVRRLLACVLHQMLCSFGGTVCCVAVGRNLFILDPFQTVCHSPTNWLHRSLVVPLFIWLPFCSPYCSVMPPMFHCNVCSLAKLLHLVGLCIKFLLDCAIGRISVRLFPYCAPRVLRWDLKYYFIYSHSSFSLLSLSP